MKRIYAKSEGSSGVFDMFPIVLAVVVAGWLLLNFAGYIKCLDILNDVENIAAKIMLVMESTGGMTKEDEKFLYEKLKDLGIDENMIDLTGTTFSDEYVSYGDKIYLMIKLSVPCMNSDMEVDIYKCAIAFA